MDSQPDELIKTIREQPTAPQFREEARAKLDVLLLDRVVGSLAQLSASIEQAQRVLGTRVEELTHALTKASESSERQAEALVRWTRWLVFATLALVAVAVAQVGVTAAQVLCGSS